MKTILWLLLLLPGIAAGQIYIDSYKFAAPAATDLLLDSFPGATVAFSFRKLDKDYTGNCITIRRVNGDTSLIGFSGNYVDTAAVKTFCGTASTDTCWVRRWFDQSGNNNNASQDTATRQPLVLRGGVLIRQAATGAANLALDFDGVNDYLFFNAVSSNTSFTSFHVSKRNASGGLGVQIAGFAINSTFMPWIFSDNRIYFRTNNRYVDEARNDNNLILSTGLNDLSNNTLTIRVNGTQLISSSGFFISTIDNFTTIGRRELSYGSGRFVEFVFYPSNQSSNFTVIERNINTTYSLY